MCARLCLAWGILLSVFLWGFLLWASSSRLAAIALLCLRRALRFSVLDLWQWIQLDLTIQVCSQMGRCRCVELFPRVFQISFDIGSLPSLTCLAASIALTCLAAALALHLRLAGFAALAFASQGLAHLLRCRPARLQFFLLRLRGRAQPARRAACIEALGASARRRGGKAVARGSWWHWLPVRDNLGRVQAPEANRRLKNISSIDVGSNS
mmetsp:Transcript_45772/g.82870  ORF Transcript_45772/g.82870 Transcript_45772/m.82870 type:complete len:210 (-) Transcript_45772:282-911(-)